ncbi:MAG: diversity-generating retroelement protein Avd [Xanthobacteraceae bacterium]|nr:MAG: diversity-generating retroelement protein Avd [Xanthobacteraceae bacterium]
MTIVRTDTLSSDALAIVEKYEAFVRYLYPILRCSPRRHSVLRDTVLEMLFTPIGGLYHAARSRQVSRLHAVDAEFATLRSYLRFLAADTIRIITPHQHRTALALLAEPGRMLGAWQKKLGRNVAVGNGSGASLRPEGQVGK